MRKCGNCALMKHHGGICPIFNQKIDDEQPGCICFTTELILCELCGTHIVQGAILETVGDTIHVYCENCQRKMGTCTTCLNKMKCNFRDDPSPIPKTIRKQIRQGNMVTVADIPNPERIDITCKKGCSCYDPEFGCFKQNNCCGNWTGPWA